MPQRPPTLTASAGIPGPAPPWPSGSGRLRRSRSPKGVPMPARSRRLALGLPVLLALALFTRRRAGSRRPLRRRSRTTRYFWSAYERQVDSRTCTAASTAMMMNILNGRDLRPRPDCDPEAIRSRATRSTMPSSAGRTRSAGRARRPTSRRYTSRPTTYRWEAYSTEAMALRRAAHQIAKYGKAVGLLVQHGRHAVVMTGFTATRNPLHGSFKVTGDLLQRPARDATLVRLRGVFAAEQLPRARRDTRLRRRVVRQVHDHRSKELTQRREGASATAARAPPRRDTRLGASPLAGQPDLPVPNWRSPASPRPGMM